MTKRRTLPNDAGAVGQFTDSLSIVHPFAFEEIYRLRVDLLRVSNGRSSAAAVATLTPLLTVHTKSFSRAFRNER